MRKYVWAIGVIIACWFYSCRESTVKNDYSGWSAYAGSKDGIRYSSNDQITTENVSQLQVAWTYSSNDKDTGNHSQIQCNRAELYCDNTVHRRWSTGVQLGTVTRYHALPQNEIRTKGGDC